MATILHSLDAAAGMLATGRVVLMPTDTLPGLHCRADCSDAVARIVQCKQRSANKPFLLLAGSVAMALTLAGELKSPVTDYVQACWPGPFSLILPAAADVSPTVTGGLDTVAVRVPAWAELRTLVSKAGGPLVSTSANRSGEQPNTDLATASEQFSADVDGIWVDETATRSNNDSAVGVASPGPSGLIDLTVWPPRVLRDGTVTPPDWSQFS